MENSYCVEGSQSSGLWFSNTADHPQPLSVSIVQVTEVVLSELLPSHALYRH